MILGRVVGELWATRRHPGLVGLKLLVVQPHLWYGPPFEVAHLIAIDTLGAGEGEDVLVCLGEPARQWVAQLQGTAAAAAAGVPGYSAAAWLPIEAAVMAIVDRVAVTAKALPGQRPLRFIGPAPAWAPAEPTPEQGRHS
jgi:microcompartment protein CcmK/EutM